MSDTSFYIQNGQTTRSYCMYGTEDYVQHPMINHHGTMPYSRNQHNIVNQLYCNLKNNDFLKKEANGDQLCPVGVEACSPNTSAER